MLSLLGLCEDLLNAAARSGATAGVRPHLPTGQSGGKAADAGLAS